MKALIISVFLSAVVLQICTARVFDDKQNALNEINTKLNEANITRNNILLSLQKERNGIVNAGEKEMLDHLETKTKDVRDYLNKEVTAAIRMAIEKSKPITVIHCIRNTTYHASANITELHHNMFEKAINIKEDKLQKIDLDEYSVNAIFTGLKELLDEAKSKINSGGDIKTIKKQAIANSESAMILFGDIEIHLHEPILPIQYIKMRQQIDKTYKDFKAKLDDKFKTCVK